MKAVSPRTWVFVSISLELVFFFSERNCNQGLVLISDPSPPSLHVEPQKEWLNQEGARRALGARGMIILAVCRYTVHSAFLQAQVRKTR